MPNLVARPTRPRRPFIPPLLRAVAVTHPTRSTPPPGTPPVPPPTPGPGPNPASPWESDPILQQIRAAQQAAIAGAQGSATAAKTQSLVNFGYDPALASLYGDPSTLAAAKANPFSVLAQLLHGHELRQQNLETGLQRGHLFYSSYRGQQLGEEGKQYLGEQAGAQHTLQTGLTGISEGLAGAKQAAQEKILQAVQEAYQRWLQQQLAAGTTPTVIPAGTRAAPVTHGTRQSVGRMAARPTPRRRP